MRTYTFTILSVLLNLASHYVYCTQFSYLTFFEAFQTSFCFFCKQYIVRRIVYDFYGSSDTVLSKI